MEQYTENLYDDDLTVGVDEYDDFVQTDDIDLFEFYGEEESSISRLKTIVLSIDWEITDENLQDFNDELLVLKDEQRDDKVNLVYIQALEKIGKYISKEKANSNHNAVKLLQSFFYTLEKNISSGTVTEEERKKTLSEDVKKFEKLKDQISSSSQPKKKESQAPVAPVAKEPQEVAKRTPQPVAQEIDQESPIRKLKAIILGMDWEITDKELTELGQEVKHLQSVYAGSKPKLIFLQGIDSIGAYIKKKKSNSHADAFKLLHSFCEKLDIITSTPLSLKEEKAILLPEVERFNKFKEIVINTIDSDSGDAERADDSDSYDELPPAFADVDDDVRGFQVDEEAAGLQGDELAVGEKIGSFFDADSKESAEQPTPVDSKSEAIDTINAFFDDEPEEKSTDGIDEQLALQGVDVETEADDESGEEPLPFTASGELAPALSGDEVLGEAEDEDVSWQDTEEASEVFAKLDGFFGEDEELAADPAVPAADQPVEALTGVDVETEADDDSDEAPLPLWDSGEVAPALSGFDDEEEERITEADLEAGVEESFDNLFGEDESFDTFKDAGDEQVSAPEPEAEEDELAVFDDEEEFAVSLEDAENIEEDLLGFDEDEPAGDELIAGADDLMEDFSAEEDITPALDALEDELDEEPDEFAEPVEVAAETSEITFDEEQPVVEDLEVVEEEEEVVFELAEDEEDKETVAEDLLETPDNTTEEERFDAVFEQVEDDVEESSPLEDEVVAESEGLFPEESEVEEDLTIALQPAVDELGVDLEDEEEALAFTADDIVENDEEKITDAAEEADDSFVAALSDIDEDVVSADDVDEAEEETITDVAEEADDSFVAALSDVDEDVVSADDIDEAEEDAIAAFIEEAPAEEGADEFLSEYEEDLEAYFKSTGLDTETDILANLRAGVSSIGVELDDPIINSLLTEVQDVSQKFNDRPVGKIMLQLMSTVINHINQYRYEASSDAHSLLLSIFDKLEMIDRGDLDDRAAQEMLLEETTKILTWQQTMLDRQAVVKGDVLTFMDPVRSETGTEKAGEFVFTKLDIIDENDLVENGPFGLEEPEGGETETTESQIDEEEESLAVAIEEEPLLQVDQVSADDDITALIKEEMKALRASFQEEMNTLRKELESRR